MTARLLVTVHAHPNPWRETTAPRVIADLCLKDQDNQTISSTRLLGPDDTTLGRRLGWQELDAETVDALPGLLDEDPTVTVSRNTSGHVEVLIGSARQTLALMGDTYRFDPSYCGVTKASLGVDRSAAVRALLADAPEPERPDPFFRADRTYISTGRRRVWTGTTYALTNNRPTRVFECWFVKTTPDGQFAFGRVRSGAADTWSPTGYDMTVWEHGWKPMDPAF